MKQESKHEFKDPTGYPPGTYVTDARNEKVYQVQPDGSWRKLPIPARLFIEQYEAGQKPLLDGGKPTSL